MRKKTGTGRTVVVSALKAESQTLQQHSDTLDLYTSGMGSAAVDKCLSELATQKISGLISWGVCGALTPKLKSGDLLIPKSVMNQSRRTIECDDSWRKTILDALPGSALDTCFSDCHFTDSDLIEATPVSKRTLADISGADAVDMESFTIADFANQHKIPFVIIRAVVDTIDDTLPSASAFNPGQSSVSFNTLFNAIIRPQQWPALIRTGGQFNAALASLKTLADGSINTLCLSDNQITPNHD